jgi:AcrR family transcriptional regulator
MPRSATETRDEILQAAFAQFRKKGFFRTGVDEVAAASRVTKRTLYNHFRSKDELLAAVLEAQHERAFVALNPYGIKLAGNPQLIVDALFRELIAWSSKPRWAGSGLTRLAVELADLPGHPARSIARRHKSDLEDYLSGVLTDAGLRHPRERARELMLLLEGAMVMIMIHGDRSYADAGAAAAKTLLTSATPPALRKATRGVPKTQRGVAR